MPFRTTALAAALALALPVHAEDVPLFVGDEIVVTPTRAPQKLSDTLAAATVLTRSDIEASGALDLPALLQGLPGVEISQTGGFGSQTAIRMRGGESDHTLVLVDGLRVNSVSAGTAAIEHLSLDDIERIEIVRGNVSSVYGSEAIGGVVRIFTRQGRGPVRPRLNVGAGTDDFRNLSAGVGGELKPGLSVDFSAGRTEAGGFSSVKKRYASDDPAIDPWDSFLPADADDDTTRNTHFNFRLNHQIGDRLAWGIDARQNRADIELDGSYADHAEHDLAAYSLHVQGRPLDNWTSRLTAGRSTDELDSDFGGSAMDRYHTRIDQLHWENTLSAGLHMLRFGLEAQKQSLESSLAYSETERRAASAYAGAGLRFGAHDFDLSLRHDRYSDFGGHGTGRAAYGYSLTPALKSYAAVATAFKAPTFNELYLPAWWGGNPDLKPERSRSAELGLNYAGGGQFFQAVLFANRTEDLIAYVWPSNVNIGEARNRGLELSWHGELAGMSARAALTLQNPEDADTGQALLRRAQRFGSFALSDRVGRLGWRAELIAAGPHPDVHVTTFARTRVPGYAALNLSADYALAPGWKLAGRVVNALDADYSLAHGYATPGRGFRLELAYAPK
jgi:Outer membrane cobalamin receptor protein